MNAIKGAIGLVKCAQQIAGFDVDCAPESVRLARIEQCRACPHSRSVLFGLRTTSRCDLCGCLIVCKTALASESCPASKWSAAVQSASSVTWNSMEPSPPMLIDGNSTMIEPDFSTGGSKTSTSVTDLPG